MSAPAGYRVGRGWLQVTPGSAERLFLHDIGVQAPARAERLRQAQRAGAWTYVQRGHAPSSCAAGGVYRISEFTLDLLRLLRADVLPTPVSISAQGASGLVAALAAAVQPRSIRCLDLLPTESSGWGSRPALLVSEASTPSLDWFRAIQQRRNLWAFEDDPMLRHGPPETMPSAAVADALSLLTVPWRARTGHLLERWLPAGFRAPDVL